MINFIQKLKNLQFPFFSHVDLYFDLGTSMTKIAIKDKGIILREPTYLGYNAKTKEYVFFGKEAKSIVGKTPEFIKIIRPMVGGVIADFDAQVSLLRKFFEDTIYIYYSNYFIKPPLSVITIVPTIATEIEQKAVQEAILKAGASRVILIEKPLATSSGCHLNVFSHQPNLVADLGGGLIELSITSGGGIVASKTFKNAGDYMNKVIYNYVYLKYGIILGEATCEFLKINLLNFLSQEKTATIRGKSLETGLPKSVRIKTSDIKEALLPNFNQIIDGIKELIESSPPEILDDLIKRGIILSGGLAKIKGIDNFFSNELKIKTICMEKPEDVTINGLIKLGLNFENILKIAIR